MDELKMVNQLGTQTQDKAKHHVYCSLVSRQAPHLFRFTLLVVMSMLSLLVFPHGVVAAAATACVVAAMYAYYSVWWPRPVYLVDHAEYKPGQAHETTRAKAMELYRLSGAFTLDSLAFQERILERSGLGDATHFPASLARVLPWLAVEHLCIHAGGRSVLDELEKSLNLSAWHMEPSRMTLYRFGNTSSSSPWYELAYCEAKGRIKKRHRVWQIAFGSGFKCNSAVWKALRTVQATEGNPWAQDVHVLPLHIPKLMPIDDVPCP